MKKIFVIVCINVVLTGTALAGEKTLYELGSRTIDIAEFFAACARHDYACTENDVAALKKEAEGTRMELMALMGSGDSRALGLTQKEGESLKERFLTANLQFSYSQALDLPLCSLGAKLLVLAAFGILVVGLFLYFFIVALQCAATPSASCWVVLLVIYSRLLFSALWQFLLLFSAALALCS